MKNTYLAIVGLTVVLSVSSCRKNGFGEQSDRLISFATKTGQAPTRGTPLLFVEDIPDMGVFAYYTGNGAANDWATAGAGTTPNFMDNIQVTNTGGTWSYTNKVYWPQAADANISFFAYSPYVTGDNGLSVNVTTGIPTISYTVPTDCSKQPDLMVSALKADQNKNSSAPVAFEMQHTLTCLTFNGTGNGQQITKIKVTGVKTTGTMTVAENGAPSWDLAGSPSGDFESITNENVYLVDHIAQQLIDGNGYLMMIPQTLPVGAKLIIGVDDGRPDVEFDLGGLTWSAGQIISYNISITPESVIVMTPDNISIANTGGYSSFNVIEEDDKEDVSWTVNCSQSWMLVCDNLADLEAWASGTKTADEVKNLDGSSPGQDYSYTTPNPSSSGSGTKTLYAWVNSQNSSTTEIRTGTINLASSANIQTTVIQLPNLNPSDVATTSTLDNAYVGAFWPEDLTGERIIRIPISTTANAGVWSASILFADANWPSDLALFSTTESTDAGITWHSATEYPDDMIERDAFHQVTDGQSSVTGTVTNGGYIYFRIGLKSPFTATDAVPARYAIVLLSYGNPVKYHTIYLRQGDDPDYVMRPEDPCNSADFNSPTRPDAKRFSAYNLTAVGTNPQLPVDGGIFTRYPSQAGYFFQWASSTNVRTAWNPVTPLTAAPGWSTTNASGFWATLGGVHETCPKGYTLGTLTQVDFRRPHDGPIASGNSGTVSGSEFRTSIFLNPQSSLTSNTDNSVWGFYADGFFDRRALNTVGYGVAGAPHTAVSYTNDRVAYIGRVFFNPTTAASLFMPAAGYRNDADGGLNNAGLEGFYWGTATTNTSAASWGISLASFYANLMNDPREVGRNVRCVVQ